MPDTKPETVTLNQNPYTGSTPCCCLNLTKSVQCIAGMQMVHGICYLIYSIISWSLDSFPRIKSSFESYYAFGQPAITAALGLILLLTVISLSDFNAKAALGTIWCFAVLALAIITTFRAISFYRNETYVTHFNTYPDAIIIETVVSSLFVLLYLYEIAIVVSFLCERSKEDLEVRTNAMAYRRKSGQLVTRRSMLPMQPVVFRQPYVATPIYNPVYPQHVYVGGNFYHDNTDLLVLGMLAQASTPCGVYDDCLLF